MQAPGSPWTFTDLPVPFFTGSRFIIGTKKWERRAGNSPAGEMGKILPFDIVKVLRRYYTRNHALWMCVGKIVLVATGNIF